MHGLASRTTRYAMQTLKMISHVPLDLNLKPALLLGMVHQQLLHLSVHLPVPLQVLWQHVGAHQWLSMFNLCGLQVQQEQRQQE